MYTPTDKHASNYIVENWQIPFQLLKMKWFSAYIWNCICRDADLQH